LVGADLCGCDLSAVDLRLADVRGARFRDAGLESVARAFVEIDDKDQVLGGLADPAEEPETVEEPEERQPSQHNDSHVMKMSTAFMYEDEDVAKHQYYFDTVGQAWAETLDQETASWNLSDGSDARAEACDDCGLPIDHGRSVS
jgi:uncharacterized protein YjbI with pentapeptide repeats